MVKQITDSQAEDIHLEQQREKHYENKEFNLSERILIDNRLVERNRFNISIVDVKEFIRLLKEYREAGSPSTILILEEDLDKLAGEKLLT